MLTLHKILFSKPDFSTFGVIFRRFFMNPVSDYEKQYRSEYSERNDGQNRQYIAVNTERISVNPVRKHRVRYKRNQKTYKQNRKKRVIGLANNIKYMLSPAETNKKAPETAPRARLPAIFPIIKLL